MDTFEGNDIIVDSILRWIPLRLKWDWRDYADGLYQDEIDSWLRRFNRRLSLSGPWRGNDVQQAIQWISLSSERLESLTIDMKYDPALFDVVKTRLINVKELCFENFYGEACSTSLTATNDNPSDAGPSRPCALSSDEESPDYDQMVAQLNSLKSLQAKLRKATRHPPGDSELSQPSSISSLSSSPSVSWLDSEPSSDPEDFFNCNR